MIGRTEAGQAAALRAAPDWRELGERLDWLRRSGLFRGLPRLVLRELAASAQPVRLPAGGVLCRAGDAAEQLYLLVSGQVRVDRPALAESGGGDEGSAAIGAEALTGAARYVSTVVADTPVEALAFSARAAREAVLRGEPAAAAGVGFGIEAVGVGVQRPDGQVLLQPASFSIHPGELVAVIGASGAGKTTLLNTLAGLQAPSEGAVLYDDGCVYGSWSRGYVPQDDIIHGELPVRRTLLYAARLRLGSSAADVVDDRVDAVLTLLGLAHCAGIRVRTLSGGERKRVSIGVELLTEPRVFYLDEPTSGLDPVSGAELMRCLRSLADRGTTVVLTTHSPSDVPTCDGVIVLAPGGNLAFAGTPAGLLAYFHAATVDDVYQRMADEPNPQVWPDRFRRDAGEAERPESRRERRPAAVSARPALDSTGAVRQWRVLSRRQFDIMVSSRLTLGIIAGSPIAVVLMLVVLFRPGAFSPSHPDPATTAQICFWLAFGAFFFGLTYGLLQICTELAIFRRERFVVLRIGPYVLAKVAVLLPILASIDAVLLGVLRWWNRLPPLGWTGYGSLLVTLTLASAAALGLGLLTSAALSEPSQAALAMPMLCFPQVLFSGAILPVPAMAVPGALISYALSNRFAFEAIGHASGLQTLWRDGGSPLGPPLLASFGDTFARSAGTDWGILAAFTVASILATCAVLRWRFPAR